MKATKRRRKLARRVTASPPPEQERQALASEVVYVGSPEHKDTPSFAGTPPRPRPDASICDRSLATQQERLTGWLRESIERGLMGEMMEGRFPRYIWHREGDVVYEGRLVNREQGQYKGYPLLDDEWPEGIGDHHG
jgi:hypothetical protein